MTSDITVQLPRSRAAVAAGLGAAAVVVGHLTLRHYLYVEWLVAVPVPVVWWVLGAAASALGPPLLFVALGWDAGRMVARSWPALLLKWVLPFLAGHLLWVVVDVAVLRRFPEGAATFLVRDLSGLLALVALPPAELSLLYCLAFALPVAKATRSLPTWLVLGALAALAMAGPAPAAGLFFLVAGLRLVAPLERLAAGAGGVRLALLAGGFVAVGGASAVVGAAVPEGIRLVVTGAAAVPFGVTAAALCGRRLAVLGRSAVLICVLLVPATALADDLLLARLSTSGSAVQLMAALVEPLLLAAGMVAAGLAATAGWQRARGLRKVTVR